MRHEAPIRVVVADDHRIFREGLCLLLRQSGKVKVVGEAVNGEEAVLQALQKKPDVLLLDCRMPVLDGLAVTRILAKRADCPKILILSAYEDDERIHAAMQAGASGYVAKRVDMAELIKIVKGTISGSIPVSPFLANLALRPRHLRHSPPRLTEKEREILQLLVDGYSNRELGKLAYLSTDTVKAYLKAIFTKLQVQNRTQAAVMALQLGMMSLSDESASSGVKRTTPSAPNRVKDLPV